MNFIIEQILYFLFLIIFNPLSFFRKLNEIEVLPFGREVKKIIIKGKYIYKYYRNKHVYKKNANYYYIMKQFDFIPKNIKYDNEKFLIIQEYKGRLLRKDDINNNIRNQFNRILKILNDNNIVINDIKPLYFNNNIYNNITIMNNKLFVIDYGDMIITKPD